MTYSRSGHQVHEGYTPTSPMGWPIAALTAIYTHALELDRVTSDQAFSLGSPLSLNLRTNTRRDKLYLIYMSYTYRIINI